MRIEHQRALLLAGARIDHQGIAMLVGIARHDVADLGRDAVDDFLHVGLEVGLGVLGVTVQLLLFHIDGVSAFAPLSIAKRGALRLQLLGQGIDIIAERFELGPPGLILFLHHGKIALKLVGLAHRGLKGDHCHFHRSGRVSQLAVELPRLHEEQDAIVDAALAGGRSRIASVDEELVKNCEPHGVAVRQIAETLGHSVQELTGKDIENLRESQHQTQWILAIFTLLALSIGIGIALGFSGRVVGALAPVVERLKAIAAGDLNGARLSDALLARPDELGELSTAAQAMSDNLRRLLGDIAGGVQTLASSATELSAISKQTAAGTASMSERAHTVAAAAEEASANTSSIAAGMEQSSSSLSSVASATEQMSATVGDISANTARANAISEQATAQARSITEQMQKLGEAAQQIGHVTETINNISAQTNLLALNATIEAARAGSAGKGFAVVANEIKELAKQTAEATNDIKARISGIQGSTGAAIGDIGQITTVIRDVGGIVASIAAAIEQQAAVTRDVAGNIAQASVGVRDANERVSHTAQVSRIIAHDIAGVNASVADIRHGGEQVQGSAAQLSRLAEMLGAQVAQFQL